MITYLYNKVQAKLLKTYLQENSTTHTFKLLNGIQLHRLVEDLEQLAERPWLGQIKYKLKQGLQLFILWTKYKAIL